MNLGALRPDSRAEWDQLRQHDVLFLLTIRPPDAITASYLAQNGGGKEGGLGVMERYGLQYVRGCEVVEVRDEGEALSQAATPDGAGVVEWGAWGLHAARLYQVKAPPTVALPLTPPNRRQADERLHGPHPPGRPHPARRHSTHLRGSTGHRAVPGAYWIGLEGIQAWAWRRRGLLAHLC